jgi:hypothetical protein
VLFRRERDNEGGGYVQAGPLTLEAGTGMRGDGQWHWFAGLRVCSESGRVAAPDYVTLRFEGRLRPAHEPSGLPLSAARLKYRRGQLQQKAREWRQRQAAARGTC